MRKVAHAQRPLFEPWLAWRELPDSVREQALDVLVALCLEIVDVSQIGERAGPNLSDTKTSSSQPVPQHGATN